jgi:hypothetical protein
MHRGEAAGASSPLTTDPQVHSRASAADSDLLSVSSPRKIQALSYWLEIADGQGGQPWRVPFDGVPLIVGRAPDAQVRLDHDTVSRHHAEIFRDPFQRCWIRDLGSRNGVKVNDRKVTEQVIIAGDVIRIGHFHMRLLPAIQPATEPPGEACPVLTDAADLEVSTFEGEPSARLAAGHLATIIDLGARLWQAADPADRERQACELMVDQRLRGEAAWILRLDRTAPDRPVVLSGPHLRSAGGRPALHVSKTLLRKVAQTGQPQMASNSPDAQRPSMEMSLSADVMAISAAACPLSADERTMDVLYVVFPAVCALPEWLSLTTLVATQYSQSESIWRARRDIEAHAAIEQDLRQASRIQQGLVPRDVSIAGLDVGISFKPCRWVGGDYVDVVPLAGGRVLLAVADACGKGLQAALVASSVHTMVRSGVRAGMGLADIFASTNEQLIAYLPEESFVTMFAMVLDCRDGSFEYANAGHPPGLVLATAGETAHLSTTRLPLGIASTDADVKEGRLNPGEMLLLFTDGWTDVPDSSGNVLGLEEFGNRVRSVWSQSPGVTAAALIESITRSIDGGQLDCPAGDDRTFLAVRRV